MQVATIDLYGISPKKQQDTFGSVLLASLDDPGEQLDKVVKTDSNSVFINVKNTVTEVVKVLLADKKGNTRSGYMPKSQFDQLDQSVVDVPANFAGLEAVAVPTRLEDQLFRIVSVVEGVDGVEVGIAAIVESQGCIGAHFQEPGGVGGVGGNEYAYAVLPCKEGFGLGAAQGIRKRGFIDKKGLRIEVGDYGLQIVGMGNYGRG